MPLGVLIIPLPPVVSLELLSAMLPFPKSATDYLGVCAYNPPKGVPLLGGSLVPSDYPLRNFRMQFDLCRGDWFSGQNPARILRFSCVCLKGSPSQATLIPPQSLRYYGYRISPHRLTYRQHSLTSSLLQSSRASSAQTWPLTIPSPRAQPSDARTSSRFLV